MIKLENNTYYDSKIVQLDPNVPKLLNRIIEKDLRDIEDKELESIGEFIYRLKDKMYMIPTKEKRTEIRKLLKEAEHFWKAESQSRAPRYRREAK